MESNSRTDCRPIVIIALGRQRVGKTMLLSALGQFLKERGVQLRVWNADQQNQTHALGNYLPETETVPGSTFADGKAWIETRFEQLLETGGNAILDVGGGATSFAQLASEIPLLETTEQSGMLVVGLFVTGPDAADLDYLEQFAVSGSLPKATVIVTNQGLISDGRSAEVAFEPIHQHRAVRRVLSNGGRVAMFPLLPCMTKVAALGVSFDDARNGKSNNGLPALGMFDRMRVNKWWSQDVPTFFGRVSPEWLPQHEAVPSPGSAARVAAAD